MKTFTNDIARFTSDDSGATSIEYALIASIVSIVMVAALNSIATSLNTSLSKASSGIASK